VAGRNKKVGARRLTKIDLAQSPVPAWTPDFTDSTSEEQYIALPGPAFEKVRVVQRLVWDDKHRIIDFAMMLQFLADKELDGWLDVIRIDCSHGTTHGHRFNFAGKEVERFECVTLNGLGDVKLGIDIAEAIVYDQWEDHIRRWQSGKS
jgi:hypothetical protein